MQFWQLIAIIFAIYKYIKSFITNKYIIRFSFIFNKKIEICLEIRIHLLYLNISSHYKCCAKLF